MAPSSSESRFDPASSSGRYSLSTRTAASTKSLTSRRLQTASPQLEVLRSVVAADPIPVVYLLKALARTAEDCCHHLRVLSNIAVLSGVGVCRFEDDDVASIHAPPLWLTERRKQSLLPELPPMALAVAEREMTLGATGEVASDLGPERGASFRPP